jgi:histidyl-tRNA synthetase
VRGLDYYTRTVFEFLDPELGAQNALCAGGRYDHLVEELGGKPTPAVGFSIGLERVMLAEPRLEESGDGGVYVVAIGEQARVKAFVTAGRIREAGIRADLDYLERSPKAQMREADRGGFTCSVIIGEEELAGGYYTLRDMQAGSQERVEDSHLIEAIMERTAGGAQPCDG